MDDRTRHDRLRSLLPSSFAIMRLDPEKGPRLGAIGVMVEVLADALRDSDRVIERALRDKWLSSASGTRATSARVSVVPAPGWLVGVDVPRTIRKQLGDELAGLGLVVGEVVVRPTIERGRVAIDPLFGALDVEVCLVLAERPSSTTQVEAKLELEAKLGKPVAAERRTFAGAKLRWSRWVHGGEAIELVLLEGAKLLRDDPSDGVTTTTHAPVLALVRGPADDRGYRAAVDRMLASLDLPLPLELHGAALGLNRQPWELDHEAYRKRIQLLGPMLAEGLATPRAVLSFALTSLGAEPCPILERSAEHPDTTRAVGLEPHSLDRCRVCKGGRKPPPGETCPQKLRRRTIMHASVIDNPLEREQLVLTRLAPTHPDDDGPLIIRNESLFSARPELVLRVPEEGTKVVPRLINQVTHEELVLPFAVAPGETLTIFPKHPNDLDQPPHRRVWVDPPRGEAQREPSVQLDGKELPPLALISEGSCFDQARFAKDKAPDDDELEPETRDVGHFATTRCDALSLELRPGPNRWVFSPLSSAELDALLRGTALDETIAAKLAERRGEDGPFAAATCAVSLTLRWWARPPACFRVQIPRKPAVQAALEQGAASYVRAMIERVRPLGVRAILDFPLEPFERADLEPDERLAALALRGRERLEPSERFRVELDMGPEVLDVDEQFGFLGVFDVTRFDISRFAIKSVEPGEFDHTQFEWSLLGDFGPHEPGAFDRTYFEHATLTKKLPPKRD